MNKNEVLEMLREIKLYLVENEDFDNAKIVKNLEMNLRNKPDINISNNKGQVNIAGGNSTINVNQTKYNF